MRGAEGMRGLSGHDRSCPIMMVLVEDQHDWTWRSNPPSADTYLAILACRMALFRDEAQLNQVHNSADVCLLYDMWWECQG